MKFRLVEEQLNELTRPQLKAQELAKIHPSMATVTRHENELQVHSLTTGQDYDIIFERDPVVTKTRKNTNKIRFTGNGTVVGGMLQDASGTVLGPAFYGRSVTHNVYDYVIRCDGQELNMSHNAFINDINNGKL